jgi:hypothetical protein
MNWPSNYKPNDNFKKYFSPDLTLPNVPGGTKLIDVVNPAQTTNVVARYLVAALLNTGPPVLTPFCRQRAAVTSIWSEFAQADPSYSPSSGAFWRPDELCRLSADDHDHVVGPIRPAFSPAPPIGGVLHVLAIHATLAHGDP